ncbi:hypothetical protein WOC76_10410 [Methylocystis sp. IM3]|jgi:hypothetical protein|uniref:hypothetical protein n=1 Tax=unclassified Methylocystis TaxID=2625913 RepID=UPI000FBAAF3D|nr:MAG: hypothetical protein EKK29_10300 [Hyphomicrobiales bacterium]
MPNRAGFPNRAGEGRSPGSSLLVRAVVIAIALAQALFWIVTLSIFRNGLLPFDLVFFWLTVPALALGLMGESLPFAAGLAMAGFIIDIGLLAEWMTIG